MIKIFSKTLHTINFAFSGLWNHMVTIRNLINMVYYKTVTLYMTLGKGIKIAMVIV